ncbi:amino acid/polyamine/organocation transporter (APC superfamily) [Allofrancisella inopinata]|uniref:APC family permease n=1 Tax=Allofrancisella inopinata TaxID=1085647 RepID=A0AAE6YGK7_9GAMM|nr:APC family permease [Allofrancisella inopinata]QIV95348.1 APC family permease [Allofrancisella inopinata]TDT66996.1 amino acid/polyamine/organocation transporter (APC superfamily) [Allofrancisella inopinata]
MKENKMGLIGLTAIGVGTMIGSGWLFSSFYAAKIAGPAAYIAWLITALIILVLGLSLAEISFNYPKRGLMARLLVISHNKDFAFICTIATWLGLTAVIATEAEGSIQYLASLSDTASTYLFNPGHGSLTPIGLGLATMIILLFGVVNFWGVKVLSSSNVILTTVKILIPFITALSIIIVSFNSSNFTAVSSDYAPYDVTSIFSAMIGAGMVYSFNGFQNITSFCSEAKNPKRDIVLATVFSVLITLGVYLMLQTAFIGALSADELHKGWANLDFTSPFVQLTMMLNLNLITIVLYADAVISPAGTGMIYTGSTTRLLTAMSQERQAPKFFNKMTKYNFSRRSLYATVSLAVLFLLLFRSWSSLVSFLSLFYVISYMSIPVCLGKLRANGIRGRFAIPLAKIILPAMFVFLSILFTFSKFPNTGYVVVFVLSLYILYVIKQASFDQGLFKVVKKSLPLILHIIVLAILSSLSPSYYGGFDILNTSIFYLLIIIWSLWVYFHAVYVYRSVPESIIE